MLIQRLIHQLNKNLETVELSCDDNTSKSTVVRRFLKYLQELGDDSASSRMVKLKRKKKQEGEIEDDSEIGGVEKRNLTHATNTRRNQVNSISMTTLKGSDQGGAIATDRMDELCRRCAEFMTPEELATFI